MSQEQTGSNGVKHEIEVRPDRDCVLDASRPVGPSCAELDWRLNHATRGSDPRNRGDAGCRGLSAGRRSRSGSCGASSSRWNVQAPKKIKDVKPIYPAEAQSARIQGIVILEVTVGTDGKVTNARPVRSIPLLDEAAIDAVRQWEFTPTLMNGVPVPILMSVTVSFALDGALAAGAQAAPVAAPAPLSRPALPSASRRRPKQPRNSCGIRRQSGSSTR